MTKQTVICPTCKAEIPLTETLFEQVRSEVRREIDVETKAKDAEFKKREAAIQEQQKGLENLKQNLDQQVAVKLREEKVKLEASLKKEARSAVESELEFLRKENGELGGKLRVAQTSELGLRKQKRELEEAKQNVDLEVARKVDEQSEKIRQEAAERFAEQHKLKDKEKDKRMEALAEQIEVLNRKLEQGSQQIQGEVGELEIEDILKREFHFDAIDPIGKGIRGGDVLQKVNTQAGQFCGSILWETKRTKAWSEGWIQKVKDDQREANASLAVIVSEALPPGFSHFRHIKGVWVTDFQSVLGLALALRMSLMEVAKARQALAGKSEKMELVYGYLTSSQFKNRVEAMIEPFMAMRLDLAKERMAMERSLSKREKQIERIVANMVGFYADLEGIVGTSLPSIKMLELPVTEGEEAAITAENSEAVGEQNIQPQGEEIPF